MCRLPTAVLGRRSESGESRENHVDDCIEPKRGRMEEAAASGGKRDHEEMSHVMALVEAARKVRAITAQPCAHGQMGSQFGPRERL